MAVSDNNSLPWKPVISNQGPNAGSFHQSTDAPSIDAVDIQAFSPALPVGAQHFYKSSFDALATIFRAEGARGLIRGIDAAILRTSMGSSVSILMIFARKLLDCIKGSITQLYFCEEPTGKA